ncbi:MAG: SDR family oxidoreductase [Pseudomonadota bacterium]
MTDSVALVTGGAKRIGKAIVEQLADAGWSVCIHCNRSRADADALAEALNRQGARAAVVQADLSDIAAVRTIVPRTVDLLGPPALLVNNASLFEEDTVDTLTEASWDKHMTANLQAPIVLAQEMAAALPADREGLIVNLIDQRVWKLTPQFFSYTLSKSALFTATKTMAQGLAPRIRVNGIGPGPTIMNARQEDSDFRQQVEATILGRGADLAEFGATIRYLWENRSITGQMIALDGGQHLIWQTADVSVAE